MTNINFRAAKFATAAGGPSSIPEDKAIEVAFAGRSNAGKSSSLNALTGQNKLAKTSSQPGRTQQINFFSLDHKRFIVDLPGYGYAKVSKELKVKWQDLMEGYLRSRASLRGVVIVMDIRHPLKDIDLEMIGWCEERNLAMHLLLTKADKLKKNQVNQAFFKVKKLAEECGSDVTVQVFSSKTKEGLPELRKKLSEWMA